VGKRLTDLIRKAKYENRPLEELQALAAHATPHKLGLPTTWSNREGSVEINSHETPVVSPSGRQIELFGHAGAKVCGGCKHFNLKGGREKMIKEQFPDRLVAEMEWKLHHLGAPPDSLAVCGDSNGELLTTIVSKACDGYVEKPAKRREFRL
jgi:hypothetical protein